MFHRIKEVTPLKNFVIRALFQNGVEKTYDIRNLYKLFPQFKVFENNPDLFKQVMVDPGGYGISWNDELDLDAEDIWEFGNDTGIIHKMDVSYHLAENLLNARGLSGMTQKQLSEITGIYQSDISKIERGIANPSLLTLKRLAEGMGMELKIEFVANSKL